jgi:cytochrome P450
LIARIALEDFDLHGNTIREGQIVRSSIASANRDAPHFPDPERFGSSRNPGRYLSFGRHGCLGAPLAKEKARIALETLFRRMPGTRLDESREIEWYRNAANRVPITLPLTFDAPQLARRA